jgi:hypothetical protein
MAIGSEGNQSDLELQSTKTFIEGTQPYAQTHVQIGDDRDKQERVESKSRLFGSDQFCAVAKR